MGTAEIIIGIVLVLAILGLVVGVYALGRAHEKKRPLKEALENAEEEAHRLARRRLRGRKLLKRLRNAD